MQRRPRRRNHDPEPLCRRSDPRPPTALPALIGRHSSAFAAVGTPAKLRHGWQAPEPHASDASPSPRKELVENVSLICPPYRSIVVYHRRRDLAPRTHADP